MKKLRSNKSSVEDNVVNSQPSTFNPQPQQIQYISQGKTIEDHLANIEAVCKAGGRWVQLRLKNVSIIDYLSAAKKCREICDNYGAIFIVNDNVGIAAESGADGVHVGLTDVNPVEARKQLGANAIIGGTANTLEDCLQHIKDGVDYIGLGPFRFTTTKHKLSPVLGTEGYTTVLKSLSEKGYQTPVIAIGGITLEDIEALSQTGVSGIAVSGLLTEVSNEVLEKRISALAIGV